MHNEKLIILTYLQTLTAVLGNVVALVVHLR